MEILRNNEFTSKKQIEILKEIYINHTKQDSVIFYAKQAINLIEKDDYLALASAHLNIGHSYRTKGDLEEALQHLIKCMEYAKLGNSPVSLASAQTAIGDVYSVQGNSRNALHYYNQALEYFREIDDSSRLATTLLNIGDEYLNADHPDSALYYFQESGDIFELSGSKLENAYNTGNIGLAYAKLDLFEQAEENIVSAMQVLESYKDYYPIAVYEISIANIYLEKEEYDIALNHVENGLRIADKNGFKEQIRDANLTLSKIYKSKGEDEKALIRYQTYIHYKDSINNAEQIQAMADLRTEYEVSQKQAEVDLLNKTKELQQLIGIGLGVFLLLVLCLAVVLYLNNRKVKSINQILQVQKEEIQQQRDQLADLNNTKDRFFSIISHDLRGPVNAFQGITRIIKAYIKRDEMHKIPDLMEMVEKSSNQLSGLLDNLLNWALSQQGNIPYMPEKISLRNLVTELFENLHHMALAKDLKLIENIPDEIELWGDRNSIMAVLRNLCNNAIKFTEPTGEIQVSAEMVKGMASITIRDSGVGIDEKKISKLFSLGEKKKSTTGTQGEKGTGLGLMICKEFVLLNKGKISVSSIKGEGTTFTILLPVFEDQKVATISG